MALCSWLQLPGPSESKKEKTAFSLPAAGHLPGYEEGSDCLSFLIHDVGVNNRSSRGSRKGVGGKVVKSNKSSAVIFLKGNTDSMQD